MNIAVNCQLSCLGVETDLHTVFQGRLSSQRFSPACPIHFALLFCITSLRGQEGGKNRSMGHLRQLSDAASSHADNNSSEMDMLPTAAPTSQYLDSTKLLVAWVSISGILLAMGWIIMHFIKKIRYPMRISERIKNKNDVMMKGEELFLHHTLASFEEVKANPTHYYMMDPSGNSSIITPLEPNAFISPHRAYVKLPSGLIDGNHLYFFSISLVP